MYRRTFLRALALAAASGWALALAATPGCGSSGAHVTGAAEARAALDATLGAWQKGEKPEALAAGSPTVNPVDSQWQGGQALESFEVVGQEPDEGDVAKRFAVTLRLKNAKSDTKTRYVVIGRDPVWVYREDDYARFLNMGDNPRPAAKRARR